MSIIDLAKSLAGVSRPTGFSRSGVGGVTGASDVRHGTAQADSSGGSVSVLMDGSSEPVTLACVTPVRSGQRVSVVYQGGVYKVVALEQMVQDVADGASASKEAQQVAQAAQQAAEEAKAVGDAAQQSVRELDESTSQSISEVQAIAQSAQQAAQSSVASVDVEYALGTSQTTAPTSGWSTTAPAWQEGRYMWQRTATTSGAGVTTYSAPTCIQGAAGRPGADGTSVTILGSYDTVGDLEAAHPTGSDGDSYIVGGDLYVWSADSSSWVNVGPIRGPQGEAGAPGEDGVGVSGLVEQYYLSTSSTAQQGGSWSTSQPEWSPGHYIWTRSQVTWSDGRTTYTDPVLAQAINGANEAAQSVASHVWSDDAGLHVSEGDGPVPDASQGRNLLLSSLGILLRSAGATLASFTGGGINMYDNAGVLRMSLTRSGMSVYGSDGAQVASFASTVNVGSVAAEHVAVGAAGIVLYDGSTVLGSFTPSAMVVGPQDGQHIATTADGIAIMDGSQVLALFGPSSVAIGANSDSSVVNLCNGRGGVKYTQSSLQISAPRGDDGMTLFTSGAGQINIHTHDNDPANHGCFAAGTRQSGLYVGNGSSSSIGSGGSVSVGIDSGGQSTAQVVADYLQLMDLSSATTARVAMPDAMGRLRGDCMSVYPDLTLNLAQSFAYVHCGTIKASVGSGFTATDGGVKCNFDGHVLVSANVYARGASGDGVQAVLTSGTSSSGGVLSNSEGFAVSPTLLAVSEGDVVRLQVANWTAARGTIPAGNDATMITVARV